MKKYIAILGIILAVTPAMGDMYGALRMVYETNPTIGRQREIVNAAAAELKMARRQTLPYVGLSAGTGFSRTKVGDYTFDYEPAQIGIEAQQNLFQGFSILSQIKAAKSSLAAQQAVLYATQQEVFLDAINAYIDVLNAAEILKLNQNNQHVLQEYYDMCLDRQRAGTLTKTDVATASARLEMARYSVADANAAYNNALETFRRIYGDTLDDYPDIDMEKMRHLFPESAASAQDFAIAHHPSIAALNAQESAARENIMIARKTILPSVDIRASAVQMQDIPVIDRVRDARVGVYLKMPIFDRGTAFANVDKTKHTVAGIQEQIIAARRAVVENLNMAWNIYDAQTAAIAAARASVAANKLAVSGIRAEQRTGRRTVLDVLNTQQELLKSQVSLTRAEHGQISAFFAVLASMGKLNPDNLGMISVTHDDDHDDDNDDNNE